jgi:hypothetical protein
MSTSVDMLVRLMCRTNVPMVDCCGLNNVGWTLLCGLITKILGGHCYGSMYKTWVDIVMDY